MLRWHENAVSSCDENPVSGCDERRSLAASENAVCGCDEKAVCRCDKNCDLGSGFELRQCCGGMKIQSLAAMKIRSLAATKGSLWLRVKMRSVAAMKMQAVAATKNCDLGSSLELRRRGGENGVRACASAKMRSRASIKRRFQASGKCGLELRWMSTAV
jgi:hypothetical protein